MSSARVELEVLALNALRADADVKLRIIDAQPEPTLRAEPEACHPNAFRAWGMRP